MTPEQCFLAKYEFAGQVIIDASGFEGQLMLHSAFAGGMATWHRAELVNGAMIACTAPAPSAGRERCEPSILKSYRCAEQWQSVARTCL